MVFLHFRVLYFQRNGLGIANKYRLELYNISHCNTNHCRARGNLTFCLDHHQQQWSSGFTLFVVTEQAQHFTNDHRTFCQTQFFPSFDLLLICSHYMILQKKQSKVQTIKQKQFNLAIIWCQSQLTNVFVYVNVCIYVCMYVCMFYFGVKIFGGVNIFGV